MISLVGAVLGIGAIAGAVAVGTRMWTRAGTELRARLEEGKRKGAGPPAAARVDPGGLKSLPAPVTRYFAFALQGRHDPITAVTIRWVGDFQSKPGGGWSPFTAEQHYTTDPPGFVWDARIRMMPIVPVLVRDSYVRGNAGMAGRIGGVIPVVNARGTAELAAGALVRYLGEAVWFPTTLLPTQDGSMSWDAIDDSTARATLRDGELSVSADFHFAAGGEITRMTAMRYRDVNGEGVLTPFEGRYRDYELVDGVMVPGAAEVAWVLPDGPFPYWRARPAQISYNL